MNVDLIKGKFLYLRSSRPDVITQSQCTSTNGNGLNSRVRRNDWSVLNTCIVNIRTEQTDEQKHSMWALSCEFSELIANMLSSMMIQTGLLLDTRGPR